MKILPCRKATGALFAFSGLDGEVDFDNQIISSLIDEDYGLGFIVTYPVELAIWCQTRGSNPFRITSRKILSDAVCYEIEKSGEKHSIKFVMLNDRTIIGQTTKSFPLYIKDTKYGRATTSEGNKEVIEDDGAFAVLIRQENGGEIKFALSVSLRDENQAGGNAEAALKADVKGVFEEKVKYFDSFSEPAVKDRLVAECYYKAISVMKSMVYSADKKSGLRWTTPDRMPHRKMWLWDSAFHALGMQYMEPRLAEEAIEAVLSYQRQDGFIPHMMSPGEISDIIQPPVLGWASLKIFENNRDIDFLRRSYEPLKKFIDWILINRKRGQTLGWHIHSHMLACKCGECGMDNSPRFDNYLDVESVDMISYVINEIEMLSEITGLIGEKIADNVLEKRRELISYLQQRFWDKGDEFFYDRQSGGDFIRIKTSASFIPLFAGAATDEQAAKMVKHLKNPEQFWGRFPVATTAFSESCYVKDYWRGPTWINNNYLIIEGLKRYGYKDTAKELVDVTISEISSWYEKTGVLWEFYDSKGEDCSGDFCKMGAMMAKRLRCLTTGAVADFGWTSSLFVHLLNEKL